MVQTFLTATSTSSKAMIAEQDFVLKLRRLHRLDTPASIFHIVRGQADYAGADGDGALRPLTDYATRAQAELFLMGNGDLFLIFPEQAGEEVATQLAALAFPGALQPNSPNIAIYHLPADYIRLRERANAYIELSQSAEMMGPTRQAEMALQADDMRGSLTAASLAQVESVLSQLDIKRYVRTQPVYKQNAEGLWQKAFVDFFVSISDLKRERFPRLNLVTPERLFLELCCALDRKLLLELGMQVDSWRDRDISLNLSAETVLSAAFARFCHVLPRPLRSRVRFEIHRSDLFLNFTNSRNAIAALKAEGFQAGIDGITPSVLPYIYFGALNADYYKINVTRDKWAEMLQPQVLKAVAALPVEKVIFSHCDHEEALKKGQQMGIQYFQGWLIDDVARPLPV